MSTNRNAARLRARVALLDRRINETLKQLDEENAARLRRVLDVQRDLADVECRADLLEYEQTVKRILGAWRAREHFTREQLAATLRAAGTELDDTDDLDSLSGALEADGRRVAIDIWWHNNCDAWEHCWAYSADVEVWNERLGRWVSDWSGGELEGDLTSLEQLTAVLEGRSSASSHRAHRDPRAGPQARR